MSSEDWRLALAEGKTASQLMRRFFRFWPAAPRCGMCLAPFRGVGGRVFRHAGFGVSRKNPNWCKNCFEEAPMGGFEVDTGILFADIRGFTARSEHQAPEEVARHLNRFYAVASDVLARHDAVIDKLVGDEVMALFVPGFAGPEYISKMADAATEILHAVGFGADTHPWLPLGLGLDCGVAFVGNVGAGDVKDFTALGDVVNTAARLQAEARPGQIVMSEGVYGRIADRYPNATGREFALRGKSEPVRARVIDLSVATVAA